MMTIFALKAMIFGDPPCLEKPQFLWFTARLSGFTMGSCKIQHHLLVAGALARVSNEPRNEMGRMSSLRQKEGMCHKRDDKSG